MKEFAFFNYVASWRNSSSNICWKRSWQVGIEAEVTSVSLTSSVKTNMPERMADRWWEWCRWCCSFSIVSWCCDSLHSTLTIEQWLFHGLNGWRLNVVASFGRIKIRIGFCPRVDKGLSRILVFDEHERD